MNVFVKASRTAAAAVLLVGCCLAQQEPAPPSFHAQTDLVTIPFQVRRGSRVASDLKPSDVVLLEDGVPRGFTIFGSSSSPPHTRSRGDVRRHEPRGRAEGKSWVLGCQGPSVPCQLLERSDSLTAS